MSQAISPTPSSPQTANEELAAQIVTALLDSNFIDASDERLTLSLLYAGNAKAGDWHRLLGKNLSEPSTSIDTDRAATHYAS